MSSRFGTDLLGQINNISTKKFSSLEEVLAFYQVELPKRVGNYHQDEVGPIMPHYDDPKAADNFVKGIFHLGQATEDFSKTGMDWYRAANGDLEWNGGFVRMGHVMVLGAAYKKTKDEKYAKAMIDHITDYVEKVPPFNPEGRPYLEYKASTWRPFEAAGRAAETWPEGLAAVINSKSMTADAWARILLSVHEHGVFLRKHHWKTGNHATLEVSCVGIIGVFYQEFVEAPVWRTYAVEFLMGMWDHLFWDDGYTKEMSGAYHWVAMRSYFAYYEAAGNNGFASLFPQEFVDRLKLNCYAEMYQLKPDYSCPITNDSNTNTNRLEQIERMYNFFKLPELQYRMTEGKKGTAPANTSYFFPKTMVGFMRSDWTNKANYLFFDMGRWGDNHMNEDQLTIDVSVFGRNVLTGSGRWRYTTSDPNAPWMSWAKYFKTTESYNCVKVDGYNQMPGDAKGTMVTTAAYDYAEGVFSEGYGEDTDKVDPALMKEKGITTTKVKLLDGVVHTRKIFFAKPNFWVLRDEIVGSGSHKAEQIWHFVDGNLNKAGDNAFATDDKEANLLMVTVGNGAVTAQTWKGSEKPFSGWHCPYYDIKNPAPELHYVQEGKDSIVFNTLLFPFKGSKLSDAPKFEVTDFGYRVTVGKTVTEINAPAAGAWSLRGK